ncbi:TIGR04283 family arsenosugar biosynthesis glycosyltransferase [Poseidonocella sp. HB161398]|uniref:TIGR04283 family arsenosugar biosynthesis glycosyltransferase n=1 Tax=Poseidonocella sp. HB161398 TaxID=2320855 RepID=UPI001109262D|nr:TIGR04283 family arsenosugar biosynthesis glycosyltransferase [Poseidonocella sp. HB161398]
MAAPITVVIPTLNAGDALPGMLHAILPGLTAGLFRELVFSDGGSADSTLEIADEVGATVISGPPGRGAQLARGVQAAAAPWLLVLHADTQLSGDWCRGLEAHMAGGWDRAGYFPLRFRASGPAPALVAGWANWRSRVLGLPYGDQGLFVSRRLYDEAGGYPAIPLMEDVAMARRLRGRLRALDGLAETSAARYEAEGWTVRGTKNLGLLARYLAGADPERLAERYRRR